MKDLLIFTLGILYLHKKELPDTRKSVKYV